MYPGDVIADRFELIEETASGGMGRVFKARDRLERSHVALKIQKTEQYEQNRQKKHKNSDVSEIRGRFDREVRVLMHVAHPAIVSYVAHGILPNGSLYLAMEWLEGEDLAAALARRTLSVEQCLEVTRTVALGLTAAHGRGIVHRDIKPGNIFLVNKETSRPKILDFGIAKPESAHRKMTMTGFIVGTVGYMSPEQARGEESIDARTDVFQLGCVLFECLTGQPLFSGANSLAVVARLLVHEPPIISNYRPEVSREIDDLVVRMLAKEPKDRFVDTSEVARAIDSIENYYVNDDRTTTFHRKRSLTQSERQVLSILMISFADESGEKHFDRVRKKLSTFGYKLSLTANDVGIVFVKGEGTAKEHALRAASLALEITSGVLGSTVVLASDRKN